MRLNSPRHQPHTSGDRLTPHPRVQSSVVSGLLLVIVASLLISHSLVSAQTFRYPDASRPASLMPFYARNMSSVRLSEFIFESLITKGKSGEFEGVLANSWKAANDGMSIKFELRSGVLWHDGRPFTADDVEFTIKAAQNPRTIFPNKNRFNFIASVRVLGRYSILFTFKQPKRNPVAYFNFKILPKHVFRNKTVIRTGDKFSGAAGKFNRKPIGTGPYKVSKFGVRLIKLTRFDKYWRRAMIKEVEMMHMPTIEEQLNLLKFSGRGSGVQAVIFIPPKNVSDFQQSDSVELVPYHTVSWWYLAFNHDNKILKDVRVRQAIAYALNREDLLSAHLGQGDVLSGPFTESSPYYNFDVEAREFELDEAKRLLKEAGYRMRNGYQYKRGKRLKLTLVLSKDLTNSNPLGLSIQSQLKAAGIDVKVEGVDASLYKERVRNRGNFGLTVSIWSFNEIEDIYPLFRTGGSANYINYSNANIDAALDRSQNESDYKERKNIMMGLHQKLNEDLPYVFLWSLDIYSGISKQVKNLFIQPYYYYTFFKEWKLGR